MLKFDSIALGKEYGLEPTEVQARYLALLVAMWKADFRKFARAVVKIRTKSGDLEPLILNDAQNILHNAGERQLKEEGWIRITGMKGRRQGYSTLIAARGYWRSTLWDRQNVYILSHDMDSSAKLFKMVEIMQANHPFPPQVGTDNAKELEFKARGSSYTVATAGQKAAGRGGATSFFHGSECAWWTNAPAHFAASVQTVDEVKGVWGVLWQAPEKPLPFEERPPIEGWVKAPSEIWLETTSAGPTGEFYRRYREAMARIGRYRHVFVPWTVQKEYTEEGDYVPGTEPEEEGALSEGEYQDLHGLTDGQMVWRRNKIHELGSYGKFRQEYPTTIEEAFAEADVDSFIKPIAVLRARKREMEVPDAPLIIGVDPAGAGGDRFAMAWRRGDKCLKIEARHKLEHDAAVAWITSVIDEDNPSKVCIDRGSMGANILSSIRALSPKYSMVMKGVDFGGKSQAKEAQPKKSGPWNRRAEIYGRMKEWLADGSIPDDDDLASDLSAPKIKYRANNDWLLESKTEMKSRGVRSPDLADALALTFATREFFESWSKPVEKTGFRAGKIEHVPEYREYEAPRYGNYGWMG